MSLAETLPYIVATANVLTMVGGFGAFLRAQATQNRANSEARAAQHRDNLNRLDHLTERVKSIEKIAEQQTAILVSFGRIEERVDGHDQRIGRLENHDAGRRITAAKGG